MPVEVEQHAKRDDRGEEPAHQLHEPRADQVPDSFRIRHHARDQNAGLGRVEERHRQAQDVALHVDAEVADRTLRRDAHRLRQQERGDRLNDRGAPHGQRERNQLRQIVLSKDVVDEVLRRRWQYQPGESVHEHQHEPESERAAVLPDQRTGFGPGTRHVDAWFFRRDGISHSGQNLARIVTNTFRCGRT